MLRQALYHAAILAVLLGASAAAHGQEPAPARITAEMLAEQGVVNLVFAWRYHPGDDPRWADPLLVDKGWELVDPLLTPDGKLPRGGWPGTGWFRRHLLIDPALWGKPVVIRVMTPGETHVFLDGAPLMATAVGGRLTGGIWRQVTFSPRPDHVLAVRHRGNTGFHLTIEAMDAEAVVIAAKIAAERSFGTRLAIFNLVPMFLTAFLALFHLAIFLSYPKVRENLFHALSLAAFSAIFLSERILIRTTSEATFALANRLIVCGALAVIFFGLLTHFALRLRTFPLTWIAFAALGLALMPLAFFLPPSAPLYWIWYTYFFLMLLEIIRVERTGRTVPVEGSRILLVGSAVVIAIFALQLLIIQGYFPPIVEGNLVPFIVLALAITMSLFLARRFAGTSRHLERRLEEVKALSEQVLGQERAAHEQEMLRVRLEAENARKSSEIDAARTLQLSMLPSALPVVEGLETAAVMVPASEVGGDYYDFRVASDGSLVVAFGDATGHGVAAGIMVTAVKALFSTLGGGESLPAVLAECDRVLREMQVRPFHMCLALARITPGSVTVCSAGMPPVLIHRAGSGEIEELGTGGRPVGSRLSGAWNESSIPLNPGDTLLFASDGFAEQLDPGDNNLGYERLADAFRASVSLPARELVERLLSWVTAWRGEREQDDDITFVVVRVTG
ncbi:MAG TPA: SpoIIE family protein phosphatase [Thermoanaerobaculia bacterium]|nr:SpoIIE family protein phosphatase [Thermoanaerobaculia bacterium]